MATVEVRFSLMPMNVDDLARAMNAIAPTRYAAPWDNVGLLVGDGGRALSRILLAIDCTREVLDEAQAERCEAIVSYHPPVFEAQKRFLAGSIAYDAARAGVAVYSPHTALDVAEGGTNDVLADALTMTGRAPLRRLDLGANEATGPVPARGMGRIGAVHAPSARALIERAKRALALSQVLVAGPVDRQVSWAAVCAGSGGDFVPDAIAGGAELLLTGELRHHDILRAVAAGLTVVCTLHSASERPALAALAARLTALLPGVSVACSRSDREPLTFG